MGALGGDPALGWSAGTLAAGVLFPANRRNQGGHPLADKTIHGSGYGSTIPQVYGRFRIAGNIIDATELVPHKRSSGGSSAGNAVATSRTFYTCSAAIAICRGPITSIDRIWAEDRLIYDVNQTPANVQGDTITIYLGDEAQTVDPYWIGVHGTGNTPAYRGLAYLQVVDLDCSRWGNRLPSLTFEVVNIVPYDTLILGTSNLQLYYSFDTDTGTLTDQGPHAYNLAVTNGSEASVTGHANQGVALTGTASLKTLTVTTGTDATLEPAQFSVEGWFQWTGALNANDVRFDYTNISTGEYPWKMEVGADLFTSVLRFRFFVFTNASGVTTIFNTTLTRDTAWHYFVVTYDSTAGGNAVLYLDGVPVSTIAAPVTPVTITASASNIVEVWTGTGACDINADELAFYNRILTQAEVTLHYQGKGTTVGTILQDIFTQVGLVPAQYDLSAASDIVQGFLVHTRQDARTVIQELLRLYDFDLIEVDGKLTAKKRGSAPVLTVPITDVGAHVTTGAETTPPLKVQTKRLSELEIPFRIDLKYYDRTLLYQQGSQGATRYTKQEVQEPLTILTTLVFDADTARQKAEKELYRQWVERQQYVWSLGPAYLRLAPGDVVNVPVGVSTRRCRIIAMDMGLLGPLNFTAVEDDASILTQGALGNALTPTVDIVTATSTTLNAWNCNALRDADATVVGMYVAVAGPFGQDWTGAALYTSRDGGTSYQQLDTIVRPSDMGTAQTALSGTSPGDVWDTVNTVDILLTNGDPPLSTSDGDVLAGNNAALLGTEIIQYVTVTPQGGNVYRLSRLLRGRRGTEWHQTEHVIGEPFVILSNLSVMRYNLTNDLYGKSLLLKAVSQGQLLASVSAVPVFIEGDELRPYSPVQASAVRDGGLNVQYSWIRRTRIGGQWPSIGEIPLSELTESYELDILSGSPKTVTAATLANAAQLTITAHGFSLNDKLFLQGFVGSTQFNGLIASVASVIDANNITINVVSTGFSSYVSGGTAEKVLRQITASTTTVAYSAANQTTDFGSTQSSIRTVFYQIGAISRGWPYFAVL